MSVSDRDVEKSICVCLCEFVRGLRVYVCVTVCEFKGVMQLHVDAAAEAEMYRCVCVHAKESEKFVGVFLSEFVRG